MSKLNANIPHFKAKVKNLVSDENAKIQKLNADKAAEFLKLEKELNAVIAKKNAIKSDPALRNQIKQNENTRRQLAMEQGKGGSVGGLVGTAIGTVSGVSFLRSATNNATDFGKALYEIERQLGENENIKEFSLYLNKRE